MKSNILNSGCLKHFICTAIGLCAAGGTLAAQTWQHSVQGSEQVRSAAHVSEEYLQPAATTAPTGYKPAQIRQAYGFDLLPGSINGAGQTIAIVDAFGDRYATVTSTTTTAHHKSTTTYTTNITDATAGDWTMFCNQFNLPTTGLTVAYPQGQGNVSTNWALETSLDIEWAHAIAPAANILLVIAKDSTIANMYAAVDYAVSMGANVVSMSFGGSESSSEFSEDAHFNHPGVTFVAASGDAGEFSSGVWYPAASPYVLGVGGTSLTNFNGAWSETAWSGSGGGISLYETMPPFQNGWQQFPASGMRSVPDVSYVGAKDSCVSVYCTPLGGWIKVYGTSVGAPQWAALIALANSGRTSGTLNSANTALYSLAAASTTPPAITPSYFFDITAGSDGTDPDDFSIPGYDFVTGLGSPAANNLAPALSTQ